MPDPLREQVLELIKQQANGLTADEQLQLAAYLVERARTSLQATPVRRQWRDLRGLYPYPMLGEDAQSWVTRNRQEADDRRRQQGDTPP